MDDLQKVKTLKEHSGIQMQAPVMDEVMQMNQMPEWMEQERTAVRPEAAKTKEEVRLEKMAANMNTFADVFKREWGKPVDAGANFLARGVNWLSKKMNGTGDPYFSMNTFAYGNEVYGEKRDEFEAEEKRSDTAVDLMDSLNEWDYMTKNKNGMPPLSESIGRLYELAQTSEAYLYTHDKKVLYSLKGKGRNKVAKKVRKMALACMGSMLTKEEKHAIFYDKGDAKLEEGESLKDVTKSLRKAAKAYGNYRKQIIKMSQGYTTGQEILDKKFNALKLYEREMRLYRDKYPEPGDRDPDISDMIVEYEECLCWKTVFAVTKHKEEGLTGIIKDHMEEEGEVENTDKYRNIPKDDTEALSPEQLKGINEIDQWLLRNFQNGGLAGSILSFVKNTDGEVVTSILSMSKRERLHMYYLVEANRRRKANITDVGASQNYTPTLDGFKDQILATKLKFWTRATGAYTYMNKLTDAFHVTNAYRKEINAVAEAEQEQKKREVSPLEEDEQGAAEATVVSKLVELRHALEAYRDDQEMVKKAKNKRQKAGAEAVVAESKSYCQKLISELKKMDRSAERENVYMNKGVAMETEVNEDLSKYSFLTKWPNQIDEKLFGEKLLNGAFETGTDGAVALLNAVTSTITLFKTGAQLSDEERAERSLQIVQSTYTAVEKGLTIASKFMEGTQGLSVAAESVKDLSGIAGVVISGGIAISQAVSAGKMDMYGHKAGDYFKQKRERLEKNKDNLSKKEKRELKYEKNMMKLQQGLTERQERKAIYSTVGVGMSVMGMIPGIGQVAQIGGVIVSIVGSVHDLIAVGKLQTTLFDDFFNLDALAEKVAAKRYRNRMTSAQHLAHDPKERIKDALRARAAGAAGFSNMKAAAEYVCSKFARLIREKLFGKDTPPAEKEAYVTFVKALNLRYNEGKGLPDEHILTRKMAAT